MGDDHSLPDTGITAVATRIHRGTRPSRPKRRFEYAAFRSAALDRKTGKVVWSKKVDNYQAGSSITSAPIIVHGHVIVTPQAGNSASSGRSPRMDVKTGDEVRSRPFVEGWLDTLHGKQAPTTGSGAARLAWRYLW